MAWRGCISLLRAGICTCTPFGWLLCDTDAACWGHILLTVGGISKHGTETAWKKFLLSSFLSSYNEKFFKEKL